MFAAGVIRNLWIWRVGLISRWRGQGGACKWRGRAWKGRSCLVWQGRLTLQVRSTVSSPGCDGQDARSGHSKVQHHPGIAPTPPYLRPNEVRLHVFGKEGRRNATMNHALDTRLRRGGKGLDPYQSLLLTETQTARSHTPRSIEGANYSARKS